ncbi:MAG TPA: hypothetical protein IAC02_06215 [Candidatus Coprovivens excrementavium]|nr:hypothetical protein [Candidatus Coprovivens excrementavium]
MAVDYEGVNGVVQNLSNAKTQITDLKGKLNTSTLVSDVGELSNLYSNHLSTLQTNLNETSSNLETTIGNMKKIEKAVMDGTEWNQ